MQDTIYALSTPFLKSAIAIVRVSGEDSLNSLKILTKKDSFIHSKMTLCNIYNSKEEIIDEALVVFFNEEKSYNGDKIVEYHLHGSIAVIKEVLYELSKLENHRLAEKGEFTKRALENDKLNLTQVEGVVDLIEAQTSMQRKQAIRELKNDIGSYYERWYNEIKEILAFFEATIDFSDEELPEDLLQNAFIRLENLNKSMKKAISSAKGIQKINQGISVAILGAPNVGKSTLINNLAKKDVAIVSSIAGTTRDIIEVFLDIEGFPVSLADTAGIRISNDEIEQEGIKRALEKAKEADIKIIMLDATKIDDSYNSIINLLDKNSFLIVNKIDLSSKVDLKYNKHYLVSLKEEQGLDNFKKDLVEKLKEITLITENPIILKQRYLEIIEKSLLEINFALEKKQDIIIMSFHLRNALNFIGKILGKVDIEDILDIIFSNFCIGK